MDNIAKYNPRNRDSIIPSEPDSSTGQQTARTAQAWNKFHLYQTPLSIRQYAFLVEISPRKFSQEDPTFCEISGY